MGLLETRKFDFDEKDLAQQVDATDENGIDAWLASNAEQVIAAEFGSHAIKIEPQMECLLCPKCKCNAARVELDQIV